MFRISPRRTSIEHGEIRRADERDFARARFVAALVTGPAGVLLLIASGGELVLGVPEVRGGGLVLGFDGLHLELPVGSTDIRQHELD